MSEKSTILINQLKSIIPNLNDDVYQQLLEQSGWDVSKAIDVYYQDEMLYLKKKPELVRNVSVDSTQPGKVIFHCDGSKCGVEIIDTAKRYHCLACPDFDLCETCFKKGKHDDTHHMETFEHSGEPNGKDCSYTIDPKTLIGGTTYIDGKIRNSDEESHAVVIRHSFSTSAPPIFTLDVTIFGHSAVGLTLQSKVPYLPVYGDQLIPSEDITQGVCWMGPDTITVGHTWLFPEKSYQDLLGCYGYDKLPPHWDPYTVSPVPTSIRLELDGAQHLLFFFVNGKQIPFYVTGVPNDVFFAVAVGAKCTVEIRSLQQRSVRSAKTERNYSYLSRMETTAWK